MTSGGLQIINGACLVRGNQGEIYTYTYTFLDGFGNWKQSFAVWQGWLPAGPTQTNSSKNPKTSFISDQISLPNLPLTSILTTELPLRDSLIGIGI